MTIYRCFAYIILIIIVLSQESCSIDKSQQVYKTFDIYNLKGEGHVNFESLMDEPYVRVYENNDSIIVQVVGLKCDFTEVFTKQNGLWYSEFEVLKKTKLEFDNSESYYRVISDDTVYTFVNANILSTKINYDPTFYKLIVSTKYKEIHFFYPKILDVNILSRTKIDSLKNHCESYVEVTKEYFPDGILKKKKQFSNVKSDSSTTATFYNLKNPSDYFIHVDFCHGISRSKKKIFSLKKHELI